MGRILDKQDKQDKQDKHGMGSIDQLSRICISYSPSHGNYYHRELSLREYSAKPLQEPCTQHNHIIHIRHFSFMAFFFVEDTPSPDLDRTAFRAADD